MQKNLSIVNVRIRRDAHTATPASVLAHELPILHEIYGKENVAADSAVDDAYDVDIDGEYQRLSNKYGLSIVEEVYGRESSGRLMDALNRAAAKDAEEESDTAQLSKRRGSRAAQAVPSEEEVVNE